jgi:heptaprenyl diphosphate synthase
MKKHYNIAQISFLIACGSALQLAEMFIPSPLPGVRIGLANISTLMGLALFGGPAAFEVAVFRPIVTSLTNGTFMTPGFVLSLCGSLASCVVMVLLYELTSGSRTFSLIAISIIGALIHNATEIWVAYLWLIPHKGVFALLPVFLVPALVGGYFVGWSSRYVLDKIKSGQLSDFSAYEHTLDPGQPPDLTNRDKIKVLMAFCMVISTIFLRTLPVYGILIAAILILIVFYRQAVPFSRLFRLWGIVVFSFVLPVLFTARGTQLWHWGLINVTDYGIHQGGLFALRLIFLILISIWIGVDEPAKLSQEMAWMLSPLKYFHFSVDRIPRLTSLSLSFIPVVWERFAQVKPKTLRGVLDALGGFFVSLNKV